MRNWKLTAAVFMLLSATPAMAIGTYAEGWMVVKKLTKLESQGIMFDSSKANSSSLATMMMKSALAKITSATLP